MSACATVGGTRVLRAHPAARGASAAHSTAQLAYYKEKGVRRSEGAGVRAVAWEAGARPGKSGASEHLCAFPRGPPCAPRCAFCHAAWDPHVCHRCRGVQAGAARPGSAAWPLPLKKKPGSLVLSLSRRTWRPPAAAETRTSLLHNPECHEWSAGRAEAPQGARRRPIRASRALAAGPYLARCSANERALRRLSSARPRTGTAVAA